MHFTLCQEQWRYRFKELRTLMLWRVLWRILWRVL